MALVVEDGTGLPLANSYADVATADAYNQSRGYIAWVALEETVKEGYLIRGTFYIDAVYGGRFSGRPKSSEQGLLWPMIGVRDRYNIMLPSDSIPNRIVQATIEVARLLSEGYELEIPLERGGEIAQSSITVGPIKESFTYQSDASSITTLPTVDGLLGILFGSGSSPLQTELVRG